jgi:hypothetical protein
MDFDFQVLLPVVQARHVRLQRGQALPRACGLRLQSRDFRAEPVDPALGAVDRAGDRAFGPGAIAGGLMVGPCLRFLAGLERSAEARQLALQLRGRVLHDLVLVDRAVLRRDRDGEPRDGDDQSDDAEDPKPF